MSDLVGNSEDRFSCLSAHFMFIVPVLVRGSRALHEGSTVVYTHQSGGGGTSSHQGACIQGGSKAYRGAYQGTCTS